MFDLNGDAYAKWNGNEATQDNPVIIEIGFPSAITYFSNLGIMFGPWNESATAVKIEAKVGGAWTTVKENNAITGPRKLYVQNSFPLYVERIRITMSGSADVNANSLRVVRIFGQSASYSGAAYVPSGGGQMYGNLDMGSSYLKVGGTTALPAASSAYRGQMISVKGGTGQSDALYICIKTDTDTYSWKKINLTD